MLTFIPIRAEKQILVAYIERYYRNSGVTLVDTNKGTYELTQCFDTYEDALANYLTQ